MIGILILSHGPLAEGVMASYCFFQNDQKEVKTLVLKEEDDPKSFSSAIEEICDSFVDVSGILMLCDIPGGTPANMAQKVAQSRKDIRIISGCNLMMALDAVLSRETLTLDELAQHCQQSAIESIQILQVVNDRPDEDLDADF